MVKIASFNETGFQRFLWIITIKKKLCLAHRSSPYSRLFRTSCFQITRKNQCTAEDSWKIPTIEKGKVNKKYQAISQLLRNKLPLSVPLKHGQKYKGGKQFKLLHSYHFPIFKKGSPLGQDWYSCLISPACLTCFAKFNDFREKTFKRANSQVISFLEKSCDGLSVKSAFYQPTFYDKTPWS